MTHTTELEAPHVCPVEHAGGLDNWLRRVLQKPHRIVGPYIKPGYTVIDIGCGPGYFTLPMAGMTGPQGKTFAVDLQQGMLDIVKEKAASRGLNGSVKYHRCESNRIGLDVQADFILAYYMVHETPDHRAFFEEVRPMLKQRGKLLVVEPPIHVKKAAFERMITTAKESGLRVLDRPKWKGGPAVLLGTYG